MRLSALVDGLRGVNIAAVELALRRRDQARPYVSSCVQQCDALLKRGLPARDPVAFLRTDGGAAAGRGEGATCVLPAHLHDGGGTRLEELVYLAAATRVLQPRKIFEIGTFKGRTTTVFALNAPEAEIVTLDLPPGGTAGAGYIGSDAELVRRRNLAEFISEYGVHDRCRQVLADSIHFDPRPHAGTVELAFIDGAHTYAYVKNDTEKAAVMMAPRGLVFWHDYGGKGQFRGITDYLHELHERFPVYRIFGTTLAWTTAENLRRLVPAPGAPAEMPAAIT
ncbi:MAG: class I SAM-dependent methyltransferase [Vicinamibacterales bacterium]